MLSWSVCNVSFREEVRQVQVLWKRAPMYRTVTSQRRCHNCSCETRDDQRLTQNRMRMWAIAFEAPRITSATISLLPERTSISRRSPFTNAILRMAALHCGISPSTNRLLFSRWCIQSPQRSRLDTSNPNAYLALGYQFSQLQQVSSDPLSWVQVSFLTGRLFIDVKYVILFCQGLLKFFL
jgi:hypothetical protein